MMAQVVLRPGPHHGSLVAGRTENLLAFASESDSISNVRRKVPAWGGLILPRFTWSASKGAPLNGGSLKVALSLWQRKTWVDPFSNPADSEEF